MAEAYILTEAGQTAGLGHMARCTSLQQAFEERGIKSKLIVNGDAASSRSATLYFNWPAAPERLFAIIEDADIVVVDSYLADLELYERITASGCVTLYLDDFRRIDYPGGIVLNGAPFAEELGYPEGKGITYLLGTRFVLLRKEFWDVRARKTWGGIDKLLITFGGNDIRNMTPKVLELLAGNYPELCKHVVIGNLFENRVEIQQCADAGTKLFFHPDAGAMKSIMLEADVAISAGGQTLCELARVGIPTIAVITADNQVNNVEGWQRNDFVINAGWYDSPEISEKIHNGLRLLESMQARHRMSEAGRRLVDGQGARRTVDYILRMLEK